MNKTRRRRVTTSDNTAGASVFELYEIHGDASAALAACGGGPNNNSSSSSSSNNDNSSSKKVTAEDYNRLLLSYMSAASPDDNKDGGNNSGGGGGGDGRPNNNKTNTISSKNAAMVQEMKEWEMKFGNKEYIFQPALKARKRTRNEWIAAYNRALILLANGDVVGSNLVCSQKLRQMIIPTKKKSSNEMSMVSTRMAFLFLEGILTNSLASHSGLCDFVVEQQEQQQDQVGGGGGDGGPPLTANAVIDWLELQEPESDPQFKFLLALYKSRSDFAERDTTGKHREAKIRSARKELKTAMEVFQHKLRPSNSGEESLASSLEGTDSDVNNLAGAAATTAATSANNNNNSNASASNNNTPSQQQQNSNPPPMSLVLQKQNQAALNLKANVEHLKGNPKKSLILLGEALAASPEDCFYDAMHANNLALVYETNLKRHLAMHAIAKALRVDLGKPNFQSDGTARPDSSLVTLYNSALCSLQARKFLSAYECMNTCVKHSGIFSKRPRCWLLMAEACIGIHANNKKNATSTQFSTVEVKGEAKGLMIQNVSNANNAGCGGNTIAEGSRNKDSASGAEAKVLSEADDLEQIKKSPLIRAHTCLETSLYLLEQERKRSTNARVDTNALTSTQLALSYVSLELRDFARALKMARLVIGGGTDAASPPSGTTTTNSNNSNSNDESTAAAGKSRSDLRKIATARMYASEASCALGDASGGMRFLVGDGQDDAFDRLASELGGVTIKSAASNVKGKARLARAQAMVRSSASAASAVLGNIGPAKQLAMSAQAMEDAYSSSREGSTARRALVYCMLREGNSGAALSLLKSLT